MHLLICSRGSWCVYAVATVDRYLKTIEHQLALDAAQQDAKQLEEAFAAADSFARRLDKQLHKRSFICGSALVQIPLSVRSFARLFVGGIFLSQPYRVFYQNNLACNFHQTSPRYQGWRVDVKGLRSQCRCLGPPIVKYRQYPDFKFLSN